MSAVAGKEMCASRDVEVSKWKRRHHLHHGGHPRLCFLLLLNISDVRTATTVTESRLKLNVSDNNNKTGKCILIKRPAKSGLISRSGVLVITSLSFLNQYKCWGGTVSLPYNLALKSKSRGNWSRWTFTVRFVCFNFTYLLFVALSLNWKFCFRVWVHKWLSWQNFKS